MDNTNPETRASWDTERKQIKPKHTKQNTKKNNTEPTKKLEMNTSAR